MTKLILVLVKIKMAATDVDSLFFAHKTIVCQWDVKTFDLQFKLLPLVFFKVSLGRAVPLVVQG